MKRVLKVLLLCAATAILSVSCVQQETPRLMLNGYSIQPSIPKVGDYVYFSVEYGGIWSPGDKFHCEWTIPGRETVITDFPNAKIKFDEPGFYEIRVKAVFDSGDGIGNEISMVCYINE